MHRPAASPERDDREVGVAASTFHDCLHSRALSKPWHEQNSLDVFAKLSEEKLVPFSAKKPLRLLAAEAEKKALPAPLKPGESETKLISKCASFHNYLLRLASFDGVVLGIDLFLPFALPSGDEQKHVFPRPCGTLLKMDPYHAYNFGKPKHRKVASMFCPLGFAYAAVDVRGTGCSEGVAADEYTEEETQDGEFVVEWLAKQNWSNGRVAMHGLSYSGFTSIQVAKRMGLKYGENAEKSPLKGIFVVYASDDRMANDVHYISGVKTCSEMLQYAFGMNCMNALPPRPALLSNNWKSMYLSRLQDPKPQRWIFNWLSVAEDEEYWMRGSLAPDYDAITCPIFHVSGWCDSYCDSAFRMHLYCNDITTVIGNWSHEAPHYGWPGPSFNERTALLDFMNRHLNGKPPVLNPSRVPAGAIRFFMREFSAPERFPIKLPGQWFQCEEQPTFQVHKLILPQRGAVVPAIVGTQAQLCWGAGYPPNGLATDMSQDEKKGYVHVFAPAERDYMVLGRPEVDVFFHDPREDESFQLVIRLFDVDPQSGVSCLITTGIGKYTGFGCLRQGCPPHDDLTEAFMRVTLRTTGFTLRAGHSLKVTVHTSYVPVVFPSFHKRTVAWDGLVVALPLVLDATPFIDPDPLPDPEDPLARSNPDNEWRVEVNEAEDMLYCQTTERDIAAIPRDTPEAETDDQRGDRLDCLERFRVRSNLRTFQTSVSAHNDYSLYQDGYVFRAVNDVECSTLEPEGFRVRSVTRVACGGQTLARYVREETIVGSDRKVHENASSMDPRAFEYLVPTAAVVTDRTDTAVSSTEPPAAQM